MKELLVLYILLFPPSSGSCDTPGCLVMHYPTEASIKVYTSLEDANGMMYQGVRAYEYNIKTNELKELRIKLSIE